MLSHSELKEIQKGYLFSGIRPEELEEIVPLLRGEIMTLETKEYLYHKGDKVVKIGCVLSGELAIQKPQYDKEDYLVTRLFHRDTVGAAVACSPTQISPYDFQAMSSLRLFVFPIERVNKLPLELSQIIHQNLLAYLASDNIKKQNKIDVLVQGSIRQRIMTYLMTQSEKKGKRSFDISFNREEMAAYLCVNRTVLSHELSRLSKDGWIHFRKNHFEILK